VPTTFVALLLTDPVGGADEGLAAAAATVELNPFGTWLTVLTWVCLLAINAWCFRRILRQSEEATA
jgi:membrane protein implicated in regulation of membrane protease activity